VPSSFSFLSKIFGAKPKSGEQALLVNLRLSDEVHGSHNERENIFRLEDEMSKAIDAGNAGEFDGNEFGEGFCTLYMYGPSALRLWEAVAPILRQFPVPAGSYVIKRYGPVGASEERVEIPE
jgi:hypothetical protein